MTDLINAAQQALEFLDEQFGWSPGEAPRIDALRTALAQEPHRDIRVALQATGCERLREWFEIGPVQRAALETFVAALAQKQAEPVQEPYCYVYEYDGVFGMHREFYPKTYNGQKPSRTVPVYTAPPQRKPLTDEEIDAEWQKASECAYSSEAVVTTSQFVRLFTRAVERALEEKNRGR